MRLMLTLVSLRGGQDRASAGPSKGVLAMLILLASILPAWGLQSSEDFVARIKSILEPAQGQAEVQVVRSQNGETLEGEAGFSFVFGICGWPCSQVTRSGLATAPR